MTEELKDKELSDIKYLRAEAINDMVEMYRLKGLEMLAEYDRGKQDEIDYVTFMEERGLG